MRRIATVAGAIAFCSGIATAQPLNDDCATATAIGSLPFADTVDTTSATSEAGDPTFPSGCVFPAGPLAKSVWYRYTSATGGSIEVDTFGSDYNTSLAAWRGTCGAFTLATCNDDDFDQNFFGDESRLVVTLAPGETVYLEVASNAPGTGGQLHLNVKASSVFQVTDDADSARHVPDVAAAPDGTFLVVWGSRAGTPNKRIVGRRYCDSGVPLGAPFQISSATAYAEYPRVARAGSDGFVVVWWESGALRGRRVSVSGAPLGPEFEVTGTNADYYFDAAADAAGNFVVAWSEYGGDGDAAGVLARRFDSAGTPLAPAFQVNSYTTSYQDSPRVARDGAGNFVVVWQSEYQDGGDLGVFGQRFDATGAPAGGEFQINTSTSYAQRDPAVAADAAGNFVVAWHDLYNACGADYCITAQRYDAAGVPQGGEFAVSDAGVGPLGYRAFPDIDRNAGGTFVVSWGRSYYGPVARAFAADGTPLGPGTPLSFVEDDYQYLTRVAVADDDDFVVVWDWVPFGSHYAVMGRADPQNSSCPPPVTSCPATPRSGCKGPTVAGKGSLTLKDKTPDSRDGAIWKWLRGEATSVAEIGDALATDSYELCMYDGGGALLVDTRVGPGGTCGTKPCWKDLRGLGFKYIDRTGEHGAVRKLVLKSGEEGRAKVIVKAQGEDLALGTLPPALPVLAQLASSTGTCWEGRFEATGVTKSTPTVFGARVSVGSPSGAFLDPTD